MYKFAYLVGALIIFPAWLFLFFFRKDLRKEMIIFGSFIGIGAPGIEFLWYLKDYWYPLKYMSAMNFVWQEALFGFFLGGIASVIYEFLTRKRSAKRPIRFSYILLSISIIIGSFILFTDILGIDSIYANFMAV